MDGGADRRADRDQPQRRPYERLFGQTVPFTADTLARLYPGGADDYPAVFGAATDTAIAEGFMLAADGEEIKALAAAAYHPAG
ncbi:hypothetical protein C1I98_18125 [Spongiactinospora gelatinilytica]|uniref:Alpha/beta hydrolase domain-containing protein n=1 Tax=Spongiactinospora gelatinilytica TaxID=2666298 RepID=A0A2W2HYL9_9ACTN|nr:alpha/beta hydrolase domain-containing protein [Spongiactinospora gelatinilytica]PZG43674.1 hypothetical protein C1I98_18125 [Spongiactinospora gelatinilytica]